MASPTGADAGVCERDEAAAAAERLRVAIVRLSRRLRRQQPAGLSVTSYSALATLERFGELAVGELAEAECLPSSAATRVADRLEEEGLVERRRNPHDRRGVRLAITEAGRQLIRERRAEASAWLAVRLARLTPAQLAGVTATLDLLEQLVLADPPEAAS